MTLNKSPLRPKSPLWPFTGSVGALAAVVILLGLVQLAVIWRVVIERIAHEQSEAVRYEYLHNANLAAAIENHTRRTLQGVERTFSLIERDYLARGAGASLAPLLTENTPGFKDFMALVVVNPLGRIELGPDMPTPLNLLDRDYFKHHAAVNDTALFISRPTTGRISGKWSIHVSRRINRPDGSFAGVVVGAIAPEYFTTFYLQTDVGNEGMVALVGLDGIVRARRVGKQTTIGDDVTKGQLLALQKLQPEGTLLTDGAIDGIRRFISYRTLKDYPMVVAVGTSEAEAMAPLYQQQTRHYVTGALATATVLALGALLLWLLRHQQDLLQVMRRSQALQKASFNLAAVGLCHLDMDGYYLEVNEKFCEILGYQSSELQQRALQGQVHPDDRDECQLFLESLRASPEETNAITREFRYLHKDGRVVWTLCSVSLVLQMDDRESYFICALQDITERQQAALTLRERDRLLAASFDYSGIGMALTDLNGRWLKVNPALCRMIGYSEAELMSTQFQEITLEADRAASFQKYNELLTSGRDQFQHEKRYRHRLGRVVWVSLTVAMVRDDHGQPAHLVAHVQDITRNKQAEEEIVRLNADLEARVKQRTDQLQMATQELTDFSYSMAHDLRQPLSSIMGFSELLARELAAQLGDRGKHYLRRIRAGVEQIGESTDALLLLARLSTLELRWEKVDLSALARTLLARRARLEPRRAAKVHIQQGLEVMGDPKLLSVVLDNLISNAWKFSSKMPQTVIEIGSERDDDGSPVYFVRDQGAGFDMTYIEKLFGNFQRLHSPAEFEGTGIGLASVQRVIMRHGGRIWARSEPGKGATFYFTLGNAPLQPLYPLTDP